VSFKSAKEKAEELHQEAMTLDDAGHKDRALEKYFEALRLDPSRSTTHYNVGLIYKYRLQWQDSFRYNKRATELAPDDEAANWNLAIAATALRDWRTARAVWRRLGMPVEEGDTPIESDFGATPVRLNPDDAAEVVWAQRIDPVRARIGNIPYSYPAFRHGDVVLHDGAAVGYRVHEGKERAVFNVLELFEASTYRTFTGEIQVREPDDVKALEALCDEGQIVFEDWTTSVQWLCKECSEGRPHDKHDYVREEKWQDRHRVAFATTGDESAIRDAIERWRSSARKLERLDATVSRPG